MNEGRARQLRAKAPATPAWPAMTSAKNKHGSAPIAAPTGGLRLANGLLLRLRHGGTSPEKRGTAENSSVTWTLKTREQSPEHLIEGARVERIDRAQPCQAPSLGAYFTALSGPKPSGDLPPSGSGASAWNRPETAFLSHAQIEPPGPRIVGGVTECEVCKTSKEDGRG